MNHCVARASRRLRLRKYFSAKLQRQVAGFQQIAAHVYACSLPRALLDLAACAALSGGEL